MPVSFNFDNTDKPYSAIPHLHLAQGWFLCSVKKLRQHKMACSKM
jgi:hypothetical protein